MKFDTIAMSAAETASRSQRPASRKGEDNTMEIVVSAVGDVAVATVPVEELDASNAEDFRRAIAPLLDSHAKVVLDLHRLRFVDSSGLGAFISCLRKLNARGGDLKLCGMSKRVRAVFEIVRMHRIFDICETSDEAVRSFGSVS
jgi:anti-sigma B factor antagonist